MLTEELGPGESVLWQGAPSPAWMAQTALTPFLFGVVMCLGLAAWLSISSLTIGNGVLLCLFGIPGFVFVILLILSPVLLYKRAKSMRYVVTNKRIIVVNNIKSGKSVSFYPGEIRLIERSGPINGKGNVGFEPAISKIESELFTSQQVHMIGVDNPRGAELAIRSIAQTAEPHSTNAPLAAVTNDARKLLDTELLRQEYPVWIGRPSSCRLVLQNLMGVPIGAFFAGLSLWFARSIALRHQHYSLLIIVVPFLLFGLFFVLSPVFTYLRSKNIVYTITNWRAIIISGDKSRRVQSFFAEDMTQIFRDKKFAGRADVNFSTSFANSRRGRRTPKRLGFIGVTDSARAEELLWGIIGEDRHRDN
jgi:hypothetical protein